MTAEEVDQTGEHEMTWLKTKDLAAAARHRVIHGLPDREVAADPRDTMFNSTKNNHRVEDRVIRIPLPLNTTITNLLGKDQRMLLRLQ